MFPDPIAILGPGLLGGSLAMDLSAAGVPLRLWARRAEVLDEARALGIHAQMTTDLAEAVDGAGLVVLATPVGVMPDLAAQIAAAPSKPALVTDMGSVKAMVEEKVGPILRAAGIPFIGAHPMCGSEKKGIGAATRGLFRGAMCLLTPRPDEDPENLEKLRAFWLPLGCRLAEISPSAHDEAVARVSHLPHLAAALLSGVAVDGRPELLAFAAGGFRDSTRVAGGPPDMWTEILLENRSAMIPLLREMADAFQSMADALESRDAAALHQALETGRRARAPLDSNR